MKRARFGRRDALWLAVATAGTAYLGSSRQAAAQSAEEAAIANCLSIIRGCQLPDGAVMMMNLGTSSSTSVWVPHYFAAYAMLALLAEHARSGGAEDLARVGRWLTWCAAHQTTDGIWGDYTGTRARYTSNGYTDAWDSSAAIYLIVLDRYRRQGGTVSPAMVTAAEKSLACLAGLKQSNDLIWGTPTYHVQLFMDLCEVYGGCVSADSFFTFVGQSTRATQAEDLADVAAGWLPTYWRTSVNRYAWALHDVTPTPYYQDDLSYLYGGGTAQIWGCAFVEPESAAWTQLNAAFSPQNTYNGFGPELWLYAASRFGGTTESTWRSAVVTAATSFTASNVYLHRPAHAALGLLEGADWMPSLLNPTL